jgi:hypothetical protein
MPSNSPAWILVAVCCAGFSNFACKGGELATVAAAERPVAPAAPEDVITTLFLIGDAGAPATPGDSEPVLAALRKAAAQAPHAVVAFLGDNVYPEGLPASEAPDRHEAERRLLALLGVVRGTGALGVFVPGNHDWIAPEANGMDAVRRQEEFIAKASDKGAERVVYLPGRGCPGPAVLDVSDAVRLVGLDTQWWLQDQAPAQNARPSDSTSLCPANSETAIVDSLRAALRSAGERAVVVVAHHFLVSGGPHGGHFGWEDHVFPLRGVRHWLWVPLPVIGSIYPLARESGISNQDASSAAYRRMKAALDRAFSDVPPLVYAAGHDHALQVITGTSARFEVLSGGGTFGHIYHVSNIDGTLFARSASGFARIEFLRNHRARLGMTVVDPHGGSVEAFALWLD